MRSGLQRIASWRDTHQHDEKRERVGAVVQAIEKVQSVGIDQQLLRQYQCAPPPVRTDAQ